MKTHKAQYERREIELYPNDWRALERIAAGVGATAARGRTAGLPSVAAMLRLIAAGELDVKPKQPAE